MFTIEQLKTAHAKLKSGEDFPAYIREINSVGVKSHDTFVADGRAHYFGKNNFSLTSETKYPELEISKNVNSDQFKIDLKSHQKGQTDYMTFCADCAKSGIVKWTCDLDLTTCTYFDIDGNTILIENIPQ